MKNTIADDSKTPKRSNQIVGNTGMYYVCYHLSKIGFNVMPTSRNARGIDIIAYDADGKRFIGIQVKSLSKRNPVPLGSNIDGLMGDYWIIVNNLEKQEPNIFVMTTEEVKKLAIENKKDGASSYWLGTREYEDDKFNNNWERIK
jgi:hypothetical protein